MKKETKEPSNINSENQQGGYTANTIHINNYGKQPKNSTTVFGLKKTKTVQIIAILLICSGLIYGAKRFFSGRPTTKSEFYDFLAKYYYSLNEIDTDANDWFAEKISHFYTKTNITPEDVNIERRKSDYVDSKYSVHKESINLDSTAKKIDYWSFRSKLICYRPSKKQFESCVVKMVFGINKDCKITCIKQVYYDELEYSDERPIQKKQ
jgi:hypothetical protein